MNIHDDERLQHLLAEALSAADPVPDHVMTAARESFTWRTIDAELAELVYDSANEELAGVRGTEAARQVTFRAPGIEIEMMVMSEDTRRLVGQLVPPQQATVELRHDDSRLQAATDSLGRFTFAGVPTGPVQISVETSEGARVVTEWMVV